MQITERMAAWRRERRVLARAAWRLDQARQERSWALAPARAEGLSIRVLAAAAGLSSSRVHQIVAAAGLGELDAALGELRAAGWPAPEDRWRSAPGRRSPRSGAGGDRPAEVAAILAASPLTSMCSPGPAGPGPERRHGAA